MIVSQSVSPSATVIQRLRNENHFLRLENKELKDKWSVLQASQSSDINIDLFASRLTRKEVDIVRLVIQGLGNKEVAWRLNTTEQVIKNYCRSIFEKAGVHDRLNLALFVMRNPS